jgi:ABC-2 type transport system ATP-binding protein
MGNGARALAVELQQVEKHYGHIHALIGAMLQESGVPTTLQVREVIELFRRMYPRPLYTRDVLMMADLTSKASARVATLSGGQRQRLYFALAMVGNPDIIFLDEPTVGMDTESHQVFWERMAQQVAQGKTILLTTHNLEEADAIAHRVIVINQGQIVAEGTPQEIKARVAGTHIRFRSSMLSQEALEQLAAVKHVTRKGDDFDLLTDRPDEVFTQLQHHGLSLAEVEIVNSGLEEAVLSITKKQTLQ